ncbi:oxygen-independent coproporphyrinogen III oxidase [Steroidobacter agaridevorans]|uniref:oxygen-independent coproporphyrinogen III oxidase n=1 Tax=Steroidobacter agaridevorans TaxID=2695856 RepID=UPI001326DA15|nr:oxygen-independent coproporphyrinogen III oxidase [Steroidobacter agaridevorans]GFE91667.1 coproporphyrinogen-III oxidase [Steroidobacter agaridevorans]
MKLDATLIRRYDCHGPRYTSYPTAVQFHPGFDEQSYRRVALLSNAGASRPLSIYVHVPFCAKPCFYCGCNKIITQNPVHAEQYLQRLQREIELQSALFARRRTALQLHFGGGTPTYLTLGQLGALVEHLGRHFAIDRSEQREFSIEIDPRTLQATSLAELAKLGFNRLSLGVQDFDPRVQRAVNRIQSAEQIAECMTQARALGYRSVSFDLIYGLPLQTTESFGETLDTVVRMRPDRIAAYGYAHMPRLFKAQRAIRADQLPDAETRLQLLALTVERLTDAGYVYIGMDHFALPDDDLARAMRDGSLHRNFQGYSTHGDCDLIGLGVSAIGAVGNSYSQNRKDLSGYYAALDQGRLPVDRGIALSMDDVLRREIIQRLMCKGELCMREIENRYAVEFDNYFASELVALNGLAGDGLIARDANAIQVTERGRALLRTIAMVFDAYLPRSASTQFSKVI